MKIEEVIGANVAFLREDRGMSQAQLGEALGSYLGKPWSRQAVSAAEKGRRAFTAAELVSLALALGTSLPGLLLPMEEIPEEDGLLPGEVSVTQEQYERTLFEHGETSGSPAIRTLALDRVKNLIDAYEEVIGLTTKIRGAARASKVLLEGAEQTLREEDRGEHQEAS
ncbi:MULTISPECIES: helix-turn-helix domain-containing protein [Streptosporangium]|uniref:HTH cro/C1-type domain-containing protein n=1 Tax=Streptosporangium pseudovulgare TaxID=35765 RepID=A0ABQ2R9K6_9ACTN|nr:helix-turn-helix transcriptional regulator [Streptosporangium pseudovulgare]GGQ20704.1 hypothetical protein GCM10010140_58710 [Streptosporangium pseudovulgare]